MPTAINAVKISNEISLNRNMATNSTKMDGIELLLDQARIRRDTAILEAKLEYHYALRHIRELNRKLRLRKPAKPRRIMPGEHPSLKATTVARSILLEGRPMTMVELTLEVQRRGCRSGDRPRAVAHAKREELRYYAREIRRDDKGRWSIRLPALPRA